MDIINSALLVHGKALQSRQSSLYSQSPSDVIIDKDCCRVLPAFLDFCCTSVTLDPVLTSTEDRIFNGGSFSLSFTCSFVGLNPPPLNFKRFDFYLNLMSRILHCVVLYRKIPKLEPSSLFHRPCSCIRFSNVENRSAM